MAGFRKGSSKMTSGGRKPKAQGNVGGGARKSGMRQSSLGKYIQNSIGPKKAK